MLDCRISLAQLVCAAILYSYTCRNALARQATLMLLVRFVRSDRKMKTRLGKVIFDILETHELQRPLLVSGNV